MSCLTEAVSLVHGWQKLSSCRQHQKRPVCLFRGATAISESLKAARELCSKSGRKLPEPKFRSRQTLATRALSDGGRGLFRRPMGLVTDLRTR